MSSAKLSVTFLGTSSAAPTNVRGLPAIAVRREGEVILMDCGEGVQRQILANSIGLGKDMTILITHLHGDHVAGILGLLQTMSLAQRRKPVDIVGPAGLMRWLEVTSELLNFGLTFPIRFTAVRPGVVLRTTEFRVKATRAVHSVEAFSYIVEEKDRPGVFHPDRAKALGVPEGRQWSALQKGRSVTVGRRNIPSSAVTGPPRPGRRIGYSGDTRPSPRLARFFEGCDLLIFDSTFRGSDEDKALERKHSTCVEAAELAKRAGVRRLALTHFSARYADVAPLLKEAKKVFPDTVAASDGLTLVVDYPPA
ncbi:MAG: ribonuclease Z [Nitrososphaerota archaeon]|jgi:ribonuclease Z|nr:ribonuclease Z [Nitrososphaerota archaeon]MDG6946475.1 ribonuclease Z [Nitrososphaerota archaeon]MDG6947773.1 ribonuclease Z [Nitrososphaerota archaeon]